MLGEETRAGNQRLTARRYVGPMSDGEKGNRSEAHSFDPGSRIEGEVEGQMRGFVNGETRKAAREERLPEASGRGGRSQKGHQGGADRRGTPPGPSDVAPGPFDTRTERRLADRRSPAVRAPSQ